MKQVMASWAERLAPFEPGADAALRTLLGFVAAFCFLFLQRLPSPRGDDIESEVGTAMSKVLSRARGLSRSRCGLRLRTDRTDGKAPAISYRGDVYLPRAFWARMNMRSERYAAEKIAFLVVHEEAHARSLDNALRSLGTINSVLLIGFTGLLLAQAIGFAVMAAIPDAVARTAAPEATIGLAAVVTAVTLAMVGAAIGGVVTNLTAAREYFADALAASVAGRHLPYVNADEPAHIGTFAEPWRLGIAEADRRLHVRGVFPRTDALAVSGVTLWALVRTVLWIGCGGYSWGQALFDISAAGCLGLFLLALPRRSQGARDYTALPLLIALLTVCLVGGSGIVVDAFVARFGIPPLFGAPWLLCLVLPQIALLSGVMVISRMRRRPNPELADIDRRRARFAAAVPLQFILGAPAWALSFCLASLSIFTLSSAATHALLLIQKPMVVLVIDIFGALVCMPLAFLAARNMKRPGVISTWIEIAITLVSCLAIYYTVSCMNDVAAASGGSVAFDVLVERMMAFERSDFPSAAAAGGLCVVLLFAWLCRFRVQRWQVGYHE